MFRFFLSNFRALVVPALAAHTVFAVPAALKAQHEHEKSKSSAPRFSGIVLANFRDAHDSTSKSIKGGIATPKFDIERAYLTITAPAGDRGDIRFTTDVFNRRPRGANNYFEGWTVRLKDAYVQYKLVKDIGGHEGFDFSARAGVLNSTVIDHEEGFWPRYLSETAIERSGFFSTSEIGAAGILALPGKWGDLCVEIIDGGDHGSTEVKAQKDFEAHMSITPFGATSGMMKSLTISPYVYRGRKGSAFDHAEPAGYSVANGLKHNRSGVFAGIRSHAVTAGAEWGRRTETMETGSTIEQRVAFDNSGTLRSAFIIVRPLEILDAHHDRHSVFGVLMRIDTFHPYSDPRAADLRAGTHGTGTHGTYDANQLVITSVFLDLTSNATVSIDEQDYTPLRGSNGKPSRALFAHVQVRF